MVARGHAVARIAGVQAWLLLATLALASCGRAPAPPEAEGGPAPAAPGNAADSNASAAAPASQGATTRPRVMVTPTPVDRSCQVDADCAVKDVGNCCGAYPACVSINSPTDPAGVMAQCAQQGTAGTRCGVPVVTGCQCVDNVCGEIARDGEFLQ